MEATTLKNQVDIVLPAAKATPVHRIDNIRFLRMGTPCREDGHCSDALQAVLMST